ncbi:MAG: hypothetical protein K0S23_995 [Fluviicola sp.]|jgi:hypothetical protein|uniref:hypothetical protein n=1 Tax=Fluviicola sp. TaxID=1917219 RepID=UPI00261DD94E|nr:hypothetical protein [Fluviicola sp.]MDF3026688.1 hypothetical protein [Fluviicola sp.]
MNTYSGKKENKSQFMADKVSKNKSVRESTFQFVDNRPEAIVQRKLQESINHTAQVAQLVDSDDEEDDDEENKELTQEELADWSTYDAKDCAWMNATQKEQLGKYKAERAAAAKRQADTTAALASIEEGMGYKSWTYSGIKYHVNMKLGTYHITEEGAQKIHYFFQGSGDTISDKQPTAKERGQHGTVFSRLPKDVQTFIKENWARL